MSPCGDCAHFNTYYKRCCMDGEDRALDGHECWWYDKKGTVKNDSERLFAKSTEDGFRDKSVAGADNKAEEGS